MLCEICHKRLSARTLRNSTQMQCHVCAGRTCPECSREVVKPGDYCAGHGGPRLEPIPCLSTFDASMTTDSKRLTRATVYRMAGMSIRDPIRSTLMLAGRNHRAEATLASTLYPGVEITAIDRDPKAAWEASKVGTTVVCGDFANINTKGCREYLGDATFDFIYLDLCARLTDATRALIRSAVARSRFAMAMTITYGFDGAEHFAETVPETKTAKGVLDTLHKGGLDDGISGRVMNVLATAGLGWWPRAVLLYRRHMPVLTVLLTRLYGDMRVSIRRHKDIHLRAATLIMARERGNRYASGVYDVPVTRIAAWKAVSHKIPLVPLPMDDYVLFGRTECERVDGAV